jgi:hypothetical protein
MIEIRIGNSLIVRQMAKGEPFYVLEENSQLAEFNHLHAAITWAKQEEKRRSDKKL